jgi:hypothetical protein
MRWIGDLVEKCIEYVQISVSERKIEVEDETAFRFMQFAPSMRHGGSLKQYVSGCKCRCE